MVNAMSGDPNDLGYERAELERFAAQRGLPEDVLAQLRSRAKNEINTAAGATSGCLMTEPCFLTQVCIIRLNFLTHRLYTLVAATALRHLS